MGKRYRFPGLSPVLFLAMAAACGGNPPPVYDTPPTLANRDEVTDALRAVGAGLEAKVVLMVNVDKDGRVRDVRIGESSGDEGLDEAALWIGERMRFEPARHEGQAVAALVRVPVTFDVVDNVKRDARLRNTAEIVGMILVDYPDLEGTARLRVRVNDEGNVSLVKNNQGTSREVEEAAAKLAHELEFWPAFKSFRPVDSWVNLVFEFAAAESRIVVQPDS